MTTFNLQEGYKIINQRQSANGKEFITEFESLSLFEFNKKLLYSGERFKFFNVGDRVEFDFSYGNLYKKYKPYREYQWIHNPRNIVLVQTSL